MDERGNDRAAVDRILGAIVTRIDLCFPKAIRSVYLYGSQAGGEVHPASDIDLLIVLRSEAMPDTAERLEETLRACSALSHIPIDALVVEEADMADFGAALISDEAVLVMGTDIRPALSYPSPDLVVATLMHIAFAAVDSYYPNHGPLPNPLVPAYPDDPWLGFGHKQLQSPDGQPIPSFKKLVTFVTRIVQGLLAAQTGRMIHPKAYEVFDTSTNGQELTANSPTIPQTVESRPKTEVLAVSFRKYVNGRWVDYVERVFRLYRQEWRQGIPSDDGSHRALRQLCEDAYRFAEWFLEVYRKFLVAELLHPDGTRRRLARRNILRLPFPAELA